jgi:hypothetical protein
LDQLIAAAILDDFNSTAIICLQHNTKHAEKIGTEFADYGMN